MPPAHPPYDASEPWRAAAAARERATASPERIAALRDAELLDSPPDAAFDRLIQLATTLVRAPLGLISLVDEQRDFWMSMAGVPHHAAASRGTTLRPSFCQAVVAEGAPVVVPDARQDPIYASFPAVTALGVAAYAGVPLVLDDRHVVGSFCVADTVPRAWSEGDVALLRGLAASVVSEIERRRAERALRESEARHRALLEALPAAVYRVRPVPPYEPFYVSPGVEQFGYSYEEWLAHSDMWLRVLHPDDRARVLREADMALATGAPTDVEYRLIAKDGTTRWVHDRGDFERNSAGAPVAWRGIMLDVTARRAAEQALVESEQRFLLALGSMRALAIMMDPEGCVTFCNDFALELLGRAREEIVGRRWLDVAVPVGAKPVRDAAGMLPPHHESEVTTRSGERRQVAWDTIVLRDPQGAMSATVSIGRDITAERALEARLRQTQKLEAMGRLAGGVAHDFNNVLAAITGYSELLRCQLAGGDARREEVEEILAAARRGAGLVHQLLSFAGQRPPDARVLDLNQVVEEFEPMLRPLMSPAVRLVLRPASVPAPVRADRTQLEQVLMNLVVNARDAMPAGGTITVEVDVLAGAMPPRVLLRVRDTGVGMTPAVRERLFEPFFTTKASGEGTGLGLATVYGIVEQSGGTIAVDSEPGRGALFTVSLPLERVHATAAAADASARAAADAPAPPRACMPWRTPALRVLLVEDEEPVRRAVCRILERSGCQVQQASDGADALRALSGEPRAVDVLLTDLTMPGMSGVELAERARALSPDIRVIFMSGYADTGGKFRSVVERSTFVRKPFSVEELTEVVCGELRRAS